MNTKVKAYTEHVDRVIKAKQHEIKALRAMQTLCRKFDGKVINRRFLGAVNEASGLSCHFDEFCSHVIVLEYYGQDYARDVAPYVRIFGCKQGGENPSGRPFWRWTTGNRLEAAPAVAIIDYYINDRLKRIEQLNATKKQYVSYLRLADKAAKLIKELNKYDPTLQDWARKHDTGRDVWPSHVWLY